MAEIEVVKSNLTLEDLELGTGTVEVPTSDGLTRPGTKINAAGIPLKVGGAADSTLAASNVDDALAEVKAAVDSLDSDTYSVDEVDALLIGKSNTGHGHAISDVTGLQDALDGKSATGHTHSQSDITNLTADLALKAPLASPAFTGTPTAPTAAAATNSTQVATTAFVKTAIDNHHAAGSADHDDRYYTKTEIDSALGGKSNVGHGHVIGDVAGLQDALDGKSATSHDHDTKYAPLGHVGAGGTAHANATTSVAGFMSASDKSKLDGIQSGAINQTTGDGRYEQLANKGAANGYASLGADGKIPASQLPAIAITDTFVVNTEAAMLELVAELGDVAVRTDLNRTFILKAEPASVLANWELLRAPTAAVDSVNGQTGAVVLTHTDVGAAPSSHDHASISGNAATATKLQTSRTISLTGDATGSASFDGSANASITVTVQDDSHNHVISNVDGLQTALDGKAPSSHVGSGGTAHANATTTTAGFMSASDKIKLDGIASGATNTPLAANAPQALASSAAVGTSTRAAREDHEHPYPTPGQIGAEPALPVGTIQMYAGSAAPSGWLLCRGQTVSRTTYAALFAVIGTTYNRGGEAGTDFRLPDMCGRAPIGTGQSPFQPLTNRALGAYGGAEKHKLTAQEMPAHTHDLSWPSGAAWFVSGGTIDAARTGGERSYVLTGISVRYSGNDLPHNNMQPYLAINFIIKV